jgi:hypothetical protein
MPYIHLKPANAVRVAGTPAALKSMTGGIQAATYIVIHDSAAAAGGHDGLTPAARRRGVS